MNENRATKEVKTKGGHTVVIKSFLTGKEMKEYNGVLYEHLSVKAGKINLGEREVENEFVGNVSDIPGSVLLALDDKMVELCVMSVDGKEGNVKEDLEALPANDYSEIIATLREFFRPERKS